MFEQEDAMPRWKLVVWGIVLFLWLGGMAAIVWDMARRVALSE